MFTASKIDCDTLRETDPGAIVPMLLDFVIELAVYF